MTNTLCTKVERELHLARDQSQAVTDTCPSAHHLAVLTVLSALSMALAMSGDRFKVGHGAFEYIRHAPVLHRPIVGKRAIRHAAQSLAKQQAADERKRTEWRQHVWQENLAQQTSALSHGAEHAFRNQQYARMLENDLEIAQERLAHAESRISKTEQKLRSHMESTQRRRPASAAVHGRAAAARDAPPQAHHRPQQPSSAGRAQSSRPQHPHAAELDESIQPAWVPGLGDPKPQPTMRWATRRGPSETVEMHHRRAPTKPQLRSNCQPVSRSAMLNGAGARNAIAPPDGWDGPYRARRPEGLVGPRELVVGLAPTHDHVRVICLSLPSPHLCSVLCSRSGRLCGACMRMHSRFSPRGTCTPACTALRFLSRLCSACTAHAACGVNVLFSLPSSPC